MAGDGTGAHGQRPFHARPIDLERRAGRLVQRICPPPQRDQRRRHRRWQRDGAGALQHRVHRQGVRHQESLCDGQGGRARSGRDVPAHSRTRQRSGLGACRDGGVRLARCASQCRPRARRYRRRARRLLQSAARLSGDGGRSAGRARHRRLRLRHERRLLVGDLRVADGGGHGAGRSRPRDPGVQPRKSAPAI